MEAAAHELTVVLCPVLNRPGSTLRFAESLRATTSARLLFLCSPDDREQQQACVDTQHAVRDVRVVTVGWQNGPGDYAKKINEGVRLTSEPWLFQAGDDLRFHAGWLEAALAEAARSGGRVIGTMDLGNPRVLGGQHATHSLVARRYVEERGTFDQPRIMLHEGYAHNFVDDELVFTARRRGEFSFASGSVVEHLHPDWQKAVNDSTYRLGKQGFLADRRLCEQRRRMLRRQRVV